MRKGKRIFAFFLTAAIAAANLNALAADIVVEDEQEIGTVGEFPYDDWVYTPGTVGGLEVTGLGADSVQLGWYRNGYQMSYYEVARYYESTDTYKTLMRVSDDKEKCTIKDLKGGHEYTFAIRMVYEFVDENGETVVSPGEYKSISVKTAPNSTVIKSLKYYSKGAMTVSWSSRVGTDKYLVQYGTSQSFKDNGRTMYKLVSKSKTSTTIKGLAPVKYYVRVLPCSENGDYYWYSTKDIKKKYLTLKSGWSVKELINRIDTKSNKGRSAVKQLTNKKVDISKYSTTYDKVMAIYKWHTANALNFVHCLACNSNFNDCLYELFGQPTDRNLWIAAGDFINRSGSRSMHKWSVVYLAGVPYVFDPRMQKYITPSGTEFFGFSMNSSLYKSRYAFDDWFFCTNDWGYGGIMQTQTANCVEAE